MYHLICRYIRKIPDSVVLGLIVLAYSFNVHAGVQQYSLEQFIAESISKFSDLKIAQFNVNRLAYDLDKAASQLGWVLTASGGYSRKASSFGIQSDAVDLDVGGRRLLESGHSISLSGKHEYNDSEQLLFGSTPNPSDTTNLSLGYRIPLLKGEGNKAYLFSIEKAKIEKQIALLSKNKVREDLTLKLIDIFYAVSILDARLNTSKKSLIRTKKLRHYIKNNINLGLLEKGEILQIDSQIFDLKLEQQRILDLKEQQAISINHFLEKPYNTNVEFVHESIGMDMLADDELVINNVINHNFDIKISKLQLGLLDTALSLSRDNEKSKLDLVMSVGAQRYAGTGATGSVDDIDATGMLRLEYENALDKRTFSSERLQIQIDRQTNIEEQYKLNKDVEYEILGLMRNIDKLKKIVDLSKARNSNENNKYVDILKRYKNGRSETNTVIQFDNERIRSELDYDTERFELDKRLKILQLKQGLL